MKRIFNVVLAVLLGGAMFTSCSDEELVTFHPDATTAQTLGAITGCTLNADGAAITSTYVEADFGVTAPVGYTLYMADSENFDEPVKVTATIGGGTITMTQKEINSKILNFGAEAETEYTAYFRLTAELLNDKGAAISTEGSSMVSNVVAATFVPYNMEILDVDAYEHVWVIGAAASVGGWSHDAVHQYLYDYNKSGNIFTGLIYYGEEAASGWKLTGIAGWQDDCNWGSEAQAEEAEASSITLISGGASKDIKCYSKQYYMWNFDKTSLVLKKEYGFDRMGIVGAFNGWNAADDDCVMNFNEYYHRFYIDYDFTEDTELKFTADGVWDLNFGVDLKQGGDNIAVKAGKYRVYLDLNKNEYEFSATKYGTEEPGAPAKEPDPVWSVIGTVNGSNWDTDVYFKEGESGIWTVKNLELTETDEFKLRFAQSWGQSVGGPEENATSKIDETNPYGVYQPTIGTAFPTGDKNIMVGEAGKYDITYDTNEGTILIEVAATGWSLIGVNGDWNTDIALKELSSGLWASEKPVEIESGSFKLRYNSSWDVNRGGTFSAIGESFAAVAGGPNIEVPAGKYAVIYNPALEIVTINSIEWGAIGGVEETAWGWDLFLAKKADGTFLSEPFKLGSDGFKLRANAGWDTNVGGTLVELGTPFEAVANGDNIKVADDAVDNFFYTIYDPNANTITVSRAWSIIGEVNGTAWNQDFPMTLVSEGVWKGAVTVQGGFKVRESGNWDVNYGGTLAELGTSFEAVAGGDNITVAETGKSYIVTLDLTAKTLTVIEKE